MRVSQVQLIFWKENVVFGILHFFRWSQPRSYSVNCVKPGWLHSPGWMRTILCALMEKHQTVSTKAVTWSSSNSIIWFVTWKESQNLKYLSCLSGTADPRFSVWSQTFGPQHVFNYSSNPPAFYYNRAVFTLVIEMQHIILFKSLKLHLVAVSVSACGLLLCFLIEWERKTISHMLLFWSG